MLQCGYCSPMRHRIAAMQASGIVTTGRPLYIRRYSALQRINHWITAIAFVLLTISGLSMFYPSLYFLSALFGGGSARIKR